MNTQQYIINDITPFDLTTKVSEVQNAFNQLTYSHIPVTKDGVFEGAISEKKVTYDFERLMEDAVLMSCSEFGDAMIDNM